MPKNTGFYLDSKDFNLKFNKLMSNEIRVLTEKGQFNAMAELLRDADYEEPFLPVGPGSRRKKSKSGKKLKGIGGDLRGSKKIDKAMTEHGAVTIVGGFNSKYAAYQHEGERKDHTHKVKFYTRPGSGPKFLATKLIRNRDKYMKIVAETIKRGGK